MSFTNQLCNLSNYFVFTENPAKQQTRHKYGTYQNVLLSDADYEKLKSEFPTDYNEWIERVSEYVAMNGKKYKDFLAVIRNWARRDTPKEKPRYM